jgi:hypothetical protein
MIAVSTVYQHVHRALPRLTLGVVVLALISSVIGSLIWQSEAPRVILLPAEVRREILERADLSPEIKQQLQRTAPNKPLAVLTDIISSLEGPWTPKLIGASLVTGPVLLCALYIILSSTYGDADKKWAYGEVGTLLGFWLGAA